MSIPTPFEILVHKKSRTLELRYSDSDDSSSQNSHKGPDQNSANHSATRSVIFSAEFLRVNSPSAEVRGHGKPVLVSGKLNVGIERLERIGHYGVKIVFSDGHDTGIFSWSTFSGLATQQHKRWQDYLSALEKSGLSRDPDETVAHWKP